MTISRYCIATIVSEKAIEAMLEGTGQGHYRDEHPWLVAKDLVARADGDMPILFAVRTAAHAYFSHWSIIEKIEVREMQTTQWVSQCSFSQLREMNPIWRDVDSVMLKASAEQMEREEREQLQMSRIALDEHRIHPYAICETPAFIREV